MSPRPPPSGGGGEFAAPDAHARAHHTDDPGTDDPGTDDPGTDDPGTGDLGDQGAGPSRRRAERGPVRRSFGFVINRAAISELRARRRLLDRVAVVLVAAGIIGLGAAGWVIGRPDLGGILGVVVPLVVVAGLRFLDVMIGVFRTSFVVGGRRGPAAAAAAVESAVWLSAAGIVLADMTPWRIAAFAVGVAAGTVTGMGVVRALRLGMVTVRAFTPQTKGALVAEAMRDAGHGATVFTGEGRDGQVAMVMSVMRRKEARQVCQLFADAADVFVTIDSEPGPGVTINGRRGRRL